MSLVAYGASDSEGESEVDEAPSGIVVLLKETKPPVGGTSHGITRESELFNILPAPRSINLFAVEEEQDEFLFKRELPIESPKKPKQPVKIGVPSLAAFDSDDDDEDEPYSKKARVVSKASGLFSLLPAPKTTPVTTKSFIPNVLTKKVAPNPKPVKVVKPTPKVPPPIINADVSDDDEEDMQIELFDDDDWKRLCGRKIKSVPKPIVDIDTDTDMEPLVIDLAPDAQEPYSGLDNSAFKQLVGSASKMNRESIRFVDIHEADVLPEKDLWLTKSLTDPECKPKYVVQDPVNDTCKRKHHITYLAQQAKANEQELQNQWSQSKYSRKQTQMKYGF